MLLIVPSKILISCGTYEIEPGHLEIASLGGKSEIVTEPFSGMRIPSKVSTRVVFPAPDGPTSATSSPLKISKLILLIEKIYFYCYLTLIF